jgi:hypothetical protein
MISFTTIISAGKITEESEHFVSSQEFSESQAEFLAQALAIVTGAPAWVRWISVAGMRDICIKPSDIEWIKSELEPGIESSNIVR